MRFFLLLFLMLSFTGCAQIMMGGQGVTDEVRLKRVKDRAEFDLDCPQRKIKVKSLNDKTRVALGCSKKAIYILDKCHSMNWASVCSAVLNGQVKKAK